MHNSVPQLDGHHDTSDEDDDDEEEEDDNDDDDNEDDKDEDENDENDAGAEEVFRSNCTIIGLRWPLEPSVVYFIM